MRYARAPHRIGLSVLLAAATLSAAALSAATLSATTLSAATPALAGAGHRMDLRLAGSPGVDSADANAADADSTNADSTDAAAAPGLSGRVTDTQGGAVAGARLRLSRENGDTLQQTMTDETGGYRFDAVPAGVFVAEIEKTGFRRRVEIVTLPRDRPVTLDLQLDVVGVDEDVVVTAAGLPQMVRETSKPLTTIDVQEIEARNAATLTEIVRFTPGIQVRDNGGPGQLAEVRIRGLRPDAAAVLVDGIRFRDASTTQSDAGSFLSNLNFVASDRVEVLRGSGSSLYGTNAVGGVVNIVTREGGGPLRAEGQAEAGTLGYTRGRASVGGGALDNRLGFSAGVLQLDLRDGLDGNDAAHTTGGQGQVRYQIAPTASLSLRTFGSSDRVRLNAPPTASGIPVANVPDSVIVDAIPVAPDQIARANAGLPPDYGNATYIPGRDDNDNRRRSWFQTTALQFRQVASSQVSWQASYQRVHSSRRFLNGPLGIGSQPAAESDGRYIGDIDTVDARGFLTPTPWMTLTAGYEFERERYFDRQDNNLPDPRRLRTETRVAQDAHAGFGAMQLALLNRRLHIALSGRAQGFRLTPVELSAIGTRNVYDQVPIDAPPRALTGDIAAAYLVAASNTKLRVHGGNAYRAPSLRERFGGGFSADPVSGDIVFSPYGDPRLKPDRYRSIDAGVDQYLWRDRLLAIATVFYVDVLSLTAFDSSGGLRPDTDAFGRSIGYVNGSGGFSRGVELSLDARPTSTLRVSTSYTRTHAETREDITVPGFVRVPGVLPHTATLVVSSRWTQRLDTTFDLFYGSAAYGSFFAAGRPRAYRYSGFTKAGLVAGYRLTSNAARPIRAYVRIDNLFDETYYQGGWRALGRTAVAGVSVGF